MPHPSLRTQRAERAKLQEGETYIQIATHLVLAASRFGLHYSVSTMPKEALEAQVNYASVKRDVDTDNPEEVAPWLVSVMESNRVVAIGVVRCRAFDLALAIRSINKSFAVFGAVRTSYETFTE